MELMPQQYHLSIFISTSIPAIGSSAIISDFN
jgi:hypothetical protein